MMSRLNTKPQSRAYTCDEAPMYNEGGKTRILFLLVLSAKIEPAPKGELFVPTEVVIRKNYYTINKHREIQKEQKKIETHAIEKKNSE